MEFSLRVSGKPRKFSVRIADTPAEIRNEDLFS
jgi:hypothetical protein